VRPTARPGTRRARLPVLSALVAAISMLAGCGGTTGHGSATASTARPFSEVQAGPVTFAADPSRVDSAIFHVTTAQPMICAIVWGETDRLGHFNNSRSMNGTGITQHDVVLPGVHPGLTYTYEVEGVTADGAFYRSPLATFTIAASTTTAGTSDALAFGANLARGAKIVSVSSEYSAAYAAANAVDGNLDTEWATKGDGNNAFLTIDLGASRKIAAFEFVTRSMADGSAITTTYTVAVDGGTPLGPFPSGTPADPRPAPVEVTGRILRFAVSSSTGGNVGAVEVGALAPAG